MQLDLRDKVFIEYNVRQVLDRFIPSRLSIKDVWELCAASGVTRIFGFWWCIRKGGQRLTDCEFLGFGGMWFPWCLRCPIAVCKFFLLIAMEKTACIGMLTVFVSPPIETPVIGGCTAELENSNGTIFRECLEEQFLCSVHSHLAPGHTYFGNIAGARSRIDHVCLQHAMLHTVVSSAVLSSLGAQLQRIRGPGQRDRIPVSMFFRHHCSFRGSTLKAATVHGICLHWQMVFCGVMGVIVLSQLLNGIVLAWPARL